jgi:tetratricopeptide (TPR) repeat protein
MKDRLDYIDSYFKEKQSPEEIRKFEERIVDDPVFAEDLAFYLSSIQVAGNQLTENKKLHFKEMYKQAGPVTGTVRSMHVWPYIAAAAVVTALIIGTYLFNSVSSPEKLAAQYINGHLQTLGVTMNSGENNIDVANSLYNEGKFVEALDRYENIIQSNPADIKAIENAGIVSLRLNLYDKALKYFTQLEANNRLYANPGKFYHALTLMKRNDPGDALEAKQLLEQVVNNDLDRKTDAGELLEKF